MDKKQVEAFISRWVKSGGSEQANAQLFLAELCDALEVPRPEPAGPESTDNAYVFERKLLYQHMDGSTTTRRIDMYKRGCFVLEAKQGQDQSSDQGFLLPELPAPRSAAARRTTKAWVDTMLRAKGQAEGYVRALPPEEGRPPFVIVADIGHCLELYAEFTCSGGNYTPFPDTRSYRIAIRDIAKNEVWSFLRQIWLQPMALDPSRRSAKVTRDIADLLARLARSLEGAGHSPEIVSSFLMRCLFTMFSEDVGLLPERSFLGLLEDVKDAPEGFVPTVEELWRTMNIGGWSVALKQKLLRFNGALFADARALPLTKEQVAILREAAKADWREVEPAIFGTLLERALSPDDRQRLGAHYTPRAYVERLVLPTVVTPLREEWQSVQAAASLLADQGKQAEALETIRDFHKKLCRTTVLDPACGSGNFLYVTLEHFKRLEGEVLATEDLYGQRQAKMQAKFVTVDPHQFLGLELNPRAAIITELVLWIGYLQWHFRTHGEVPPPEPVVQKFNNIECCDAVLRWTKRAFATDEHGRVVTRWDGRTTKTDPVTGLDVPDETAQVPEEVFTAPAPAKWPAADFIVGNPPFIGGGGDRGKRTVLGGGYFDALVAAYPDLPPACDFVMYWWHNAANLVRHGKARRFGFITTNSLSHIFNRRVIALHTKGKPALSLAFAIPDHPWVNAADGASVRIAMSVGQAGASEGCLATVIEEKPASGLEMQITLRERMGRINPDLTVGVDVSSAFPLKAAENLSCPGVKLHGSGFIVTHEEAKDLGLGRIPGLEMHIRPYMNGKDLTGKSRNAMVIDLFGLSEAQVKDRFPEVYQWVRERVKPERDQNNRQTYRENWWIFGEPRRDFRPALADLSRYIATVETAKHRLFVFLDAKVLPDNMLVNIASSDSYVFGVLSSSIHIIWALAAGGTLEDRPRYNKTRCFETFPFPDANPDSKKCIREIAEKIDSHRKRQQALYPRLTLTSMYNVLEALREGRKLEDAERVIHEQGLVGVLRQDHDALDAAVAAAYGWPPDLTDDQILERLVRLNAERAAEEERGLVRWLRPEYQHTPQPRQRQAGLGVEIPKPKKTTRTAAETSRPRLPWPKPLAEQVSLVRLVLTDLANPSTVEDVAQRFLRASKPKVLEVLNALVNLGLARQADGEDRYIAL